MIFQFLKWYGALFLILFALAGNSLAEFDPGLIGKGFKGGVNIANVANNADAESRTSYMLGFLVNYPMIKNIDFQMELVIVGKGYQVSDTAVLDSLGNKVSTADWQGLVTYIEIPVTAKLSLPVAGKVTPYLNLGGFVSQAIIKKERRTSDISGLAYEIDMDNVKTTDAGFVAAAGLDMKSGNGMIFLEARYDYSNISMLKYTKYRSRVWMFQVGYWW